MLLGIVFSTFSLQEKRCYGYNENDTGAVKDVRDKDRQSNVETIDRKSSSNPENIDNGENQVSNGTQSKPAQPGIAKVGNTGAEHND